VSCACRIHKVIWRIKGKQADMTDVILKIQPSLMRRVFSVIVLALCAFVLISFAITGTAQSVGVKLVLISLGGMFLWQAQAGFRLSNTALILKRDGLFDEYDTLICSLSNIALIDRGWFSFKPSNGFLVRLHQPQSRKWVPGLYWRIGRRLGVGGALSPAQTKTMSDKILLLMQEQKLDMELL